MGRRPDGEVVELVRDLARLTSPRSATPRNFGLYLAGAAVREHARRRGLEGVPFEEFVAGVLLLFVNPERNASRP